MSIDLIQSIYYTSMLRGVAALSAQRQESRAAANSAAAESADSVTLSDAGKALPAGNIQRHGAADCGAKAGGV